MLNTLRERLAEHKEPSPCVSGVTVWATTKICAVAGTTISPGVGTVIGAIVGFIVGIIYGLCGQEAIDKSIA